MGRQVIKIGRNLDVYVGWSDVTQAPTWFGTRAEAFDYLVDELAGWATTRRGPVVPDAAATRRHRADAEAMLARADEYGSSASEVGYTWWSGDHLQAGQSPRHLGRAELLHLVDWCTEHPDVPYEDAVLLFHLDDPAAVDRYVPPPQRHRRGA